MRPISHTFQNDTSKSAEDTSNMHVDPLQISPHPIRDPAVDLADDDDVSSQPLPQSMENSSNNTSTISSGVEEYVNNENENDNDNRCRIRYRPYLGLCNFFVTICVVVMFIIFVLMWDDIRSPCGKYFSKFSKYTPMCNHGNISMSIYDMHCNRGCIYNETCDGWPDLKRDDSICTLARYQTYTPVSYASVRNLEYMILGICIFAIMTVLAHILYAWDIYRQKHVSRIITAEWYFLKHIHVILCAMFTTWLVFYTIFVIYQTQFKDNTLRKYIDILCILYIGVSVFIFVPYVLNAMALFISHRDTRSL